MTASVDNWIDRLRLDLKAWRETGRPPPPKCPPGQPPPEPIAYLFSQVHAARTVRRQAETAGVARVKLQRLDIEIQRVTEATEEIAAASRLIRAASEPESG